MKLIVADLDGTLFDTRKVNYLAYREAVRAYGYDLEYSYFCEFCNGRHYLEFLPAITTTDPDLLTQIHELKKKAYGKYLDHARLNQELLNLIRCLKGTFKTALITTASRVNTFELLRRFQVKEVFDLILTQEDVLEKKPSPEGYQKALRYFGISAADAIAFEDSEFGIEAAKRAGIACFVVKGYA